MRALVASLFNTGERVVGSEAAGILRRACEGSVGITVRASFGVLCFAVPGASHLISGDPYAA